MLRTWATVTAVYGGVRVFFYKDNLRATNGTRLEIEQIGSLAFVSAAIAPIAAPLYAINDLYYSLCPACNMAVDPTPFPFRNFGFVHAKPRMTITFDKK